MKEGNIATWHTILLTVTQTVVRREQSDLMDNTICSYADHCWKGAKWSDGQHYLQLRRLLLEGSKVTWWTTLSAATQTIVGREQSDLMDNTICSYADRCWKGAKQPDGQHYLQLCRPLLEGSKADWLQHNLNNTELVEGSRGARGPDENLIYILPECEWCR